nr:P-loop NTPase domain-containing protein LPA1 homolog 1-like [Ipomoea batatas]
MRGGVSGAAGGLEETSRLERESGRVVVVWSGGSVWWRESESCGRMGEDGLAESLRVKKEVVVARVRVRCEVGEGCVWVEEMSGGLEVICRKVGAVRGVEERRGRGSDGWVRGGEGGVVRDGDKYPVQDKDKLRNNLKIIQDYLCSFESQGLIVANTSAAAFPQALDWLHNYLLQRIEEGISSVPSGNSG